MICTCTSLLLSFTVHDSKKCAVKLLIYESITEMGQGQIFKIWSFESHITRITVLLYYRVMQDD